MSYLESNKKHKPEKRVYPLGVDFNPALPNVGAILNKYKHIISLDVELINVIKPIDIFASYRDMLVHSKLPLMNEVIPVYSPNFQGCKPCKKRCVVCKII